MIDFSAEFERSPLMLILRGLGAERSLELASRAWDAGIGLVEIPLQSDQDADALAALVHAGAARSRLVGAGTIVSTALVDRARSLGAAFTVAPGVDAEVARASAGAGLAHLPGVATASDIQAAVALGCSWVKMFPAAQLGPGWARAMRGPFPDVRIVATGGMSSANAVEFLEAGVDAVAVGAALADPDELAALRAIAASPRWLRA
ncbi:bifunctional 4-hydroxy-2-oxoglutarate aldolase/2-dehydro-3-deoxy-phosphogluconate aldolase [Leifsonia sp. H3M29-4]|uniref:bifunctional 4-hydroxy-2-oxoglutarate aldolase/2-dehydro-3-deoxy-phosphogluconate aldolase n=1 Tax=Salinibacterium metalliresistens TaxID=3031321 RepID=UPI0023D995FA|nr:bifunctional 4-hydroxy-2-oxoglutarate aldolase/2-dehydro-3-deoxy-phosphogluconate aldolase [Salinibacterium metalliresistens]MDF1478146.1 bifunctional 4-hydroxy-2-oxoglutarate aldolase/2-dehydro-3-deoxy-phosphogluconate aldolase [Salinibacterium metalliresistens]